MILEGQVFPLQKSLKIYRPLVGKYLRLDEISSPFGRLVTQI